jgi:hypothetical protein
MAIDRQKLIERATALLNDAQKFDARRQASGISHFEVHDLAARGANLIGSVTGANSVYSENLRVALKQKLATHQFAAVVGVLQGFYLDLVNDHLVNIRHEVETVVISEILTQAQTLLKSKNVHPAAAIIVGCAAVEEFLRNWCEERNIAIPERQRSIGRFAQELRMQGHIDLPVERRIQSWADYRNEAAHGANWSKITRDIADRTLNEIGAFILENRQILG